MDPNSRWHLGRRDNRRLAMQAETGDGPGKARGRIVLSGLFAGPALLALILFLSPPASMSEAAWRCAGLAMLMAVWWATEAVPIAVTALLPIILVPALGLGSIGKATTPYADPVIFLFLGGFLLGLAMQSWNLHRRIALLTLRMVGPRPRSQVAGFMLVTGFLSMWVSNTATCIMMLPIGLSVVATKDQGDDGQQRFRTTLLLAIAYSASIGGIATLIGTPPNAMLAAYLSGTQSIEIGFAQWMSIGLPVALIMMAITFWWLTRGKFPSREVAGSRVAVRESLDAMGPVTPGERRVLVVFVLAALTWIIRPWLQQAVPWLSDTAVALVAALLLFVLPAPGNRGRLLSWSRAVDVPWGVLLLFGGGLSLAEAIQSSGLGLWIAQGLDFPDSFPLLLVIATVVAVIIFLTEITSNTATAATFLPLVGAVAAGLGASQLYLVVPAAIAASCAFMMPVATPPNAIVFASGDIRMPQMIRAGAVLNLLGIPVITLAGYGMVALWLSGG